MSTNFETVDVDPRKLRGHGRNPYTHSPKQIAALSRSLEEFGWLQVVIVSRRTGRILDGHARVSEAVDQEMASVPVRYVDVDEEGELRILAAVNRIGMLAETDEEKLHALLSELSATAAGLAPGWEEADLADLTALIEREIDTLDPFAEIEGEEEDGDAETETAEEFEEEIPEEVPSRCKDGDLWKLGNHRLFVGDCRDERGVARLLDGAKIDLVFTSPPYAQQRAYDVTSGFTPVPENEYVTWYHDVQRVLAIHLADTGSYFLNIKEHSKDGQRALYVKDLVLTHVRQWGWRFVDELIWLHQGYPGEMKGRFKNRFEPVFHFTLSKDHKFRPLAVSTVQEDVRDATSYRERGGVEVRCETNDKTFARERKKADDGMARPGNVVTVNKGATAKDTGAMHEAVFPWQLPSWFIKAFTDERDLVFDPFLGSGTTLIAAEREKRVCYGTEISPLYADVILARWERLTGQEAVLL